MNYALLVCKIFGPKNRLCKFFNKSYVWKGRTAFSRALLGKMLTGKRLFFMLYNLLGLPNTGKTSGLVGHVGIS